jgi:hypothetical protein
MTQTLAPAAKQSPTEKRLDFIAKATKPVNDRALAILAAKSVGMDLQDLTTAELTEVAEKMVEGQILGRTDRWKNACAFAAHEIGQAKKSGQLDASFARWAVVQGSVWMCHAAD